jgi:hypothetical protein
VEDWDRTLDGVAVLLLRYGRQGPLEVCAGKHFDDMMAEEQYAFAGFGIESLQDRGGVEAGKPVWNVGEKALFAEQFGNPDPANPP